MGNVAKYLCLQERETTKPTQVDLAIKLKGNQSRASEERVKLKAVSCLTPVRGNFDQEQALSKAVGHRVSIQDFILYSVLAF